MRGVPCWDAPPELMWDMELHSAIHAVGQRQDRRRLTGQSSMIGFDIASVTVMVLSHMGSAITQGMPRQLLQQATSGKELKDRDKDRGRTRRALSDIVLDPERPQHNSHGCIANLGTRDFLIAGHAGRRQRSRCRQVELKGVIYL